MVEQNLLKCIGCYHNGPETGSDSDSASDFDNDNDSNSVRVAAIKTKPNSQHPKPLCDTLQETTGKQRTFIKARPKEPLSATPPSSPPEQFFFHHQNESRSCLGRMTVIASSMAWSRHPKFMLLAYPGPHTKSDCDRNVACKGSTLLRVESQTSCA